jgi:hypothetical protein
MADGAESPYHVSGKCPIRHCPKVRMILIVSAMARAATGDFRCPMRRKE